MSSSASRATSSEARLLRAYRRTSYAAAGVVVRIGRRASLAWRSAVFVTAWNPRSRRMPDGWNHRMQQRLRERVRRCETLEADGRLGRWHEAHLLVMADVRPMLRLARIFRQRAIVVAQRQQPAKLVMIVYPKD